MPLTVMLPSDEYSKLHKRASRRGMTPEDYLRTIALDKLNPRRASDYLLTKEEKKTIATLNDELTRDFWSRYYELQELARTEISDVEHEELMRLLDKAEEWNVRRLTLLMEMAKQRGIDMTTFMRRNKIRHHPVANEFSAEYRSR